MKKVFLTLVLASTSFLASSQVVRVGLGFGTPLSGNANSGGISASGELAYAPQPKIDFGVHLGVGAGTSDIASESVDAGVRYGVHSRYYLKTGTFKPYVGLFATMFSGGEIDATSQSIVSKKSNFGATPTVGFRLGPLNLNAGYTLGGGSFKGLNAGFGLLFGFGKFKD